MEAYERRGKERRGEKRRHKLEFVTEERGHNPVSVTRHFTFAWGVLSALSVMATARLGFSFLSQIPIEVNSQFGAH